MYLGVRVRVADSPAVAGMDVRHSLGAGGDGADLTQLVGSLRGSDPAEKGYKVSRHMFKGKWFVLSIQVW